MNGRVEEARTLFERLVGLANDLGLLAEEYDVARRRQVGNFPQAFSHLTLILAARAISAAEADANAGGRLSATWRIPRGGQDLDRQQPDDPRRPGSFVGEAQNASWFGGQKRLDVVYADTHSGEEVGVDAHHATRG